jgi:hypothetical protein
MPSNECKHLFDHEETHCTICGLTVNEIDIYEKVAAMEKQMFKFAQDLEMHYTSDVRAWESMEKRHDKRLDAIFGKLLEKLDASDGNQLKPMKKKEGKFKSIKEFKKHLDELECPTIKEASISCIYCGGDNKGLKIMRFFLASLEDICPKHTLEAIQKTQDYFNKNHSEWYEKNREPSPTEDDDWRDWWSTEEDYKRYFILLKKAKEKQKAEFVAALREIEMIHVKGVACIMWSEIEKLIAKYSAGTEEVKKKE